MQVDDGHRDSRAAVFEPIYRPGQVLAQAAFVPLQRLGKAHGEWRELAIYADMYRAGLHRQQALTGMLSPKFEQKTGLTGEQVLASIAARPGGDIYTFNNASHLAYISYNCWQGGEVSHPGLVERATALLAAVGIPLDVAEAGRQSSRILCYCNNWVATEAFWEAYVGGVLEPIARFLETHPGSAEARAVLEPTTHETPAPFLPFIIERLLPTYLAVTPLTIVAQPCDPLEACDNNFERDLVHAMRDRVERADREETYPPELMRWQALCTRLRRRYGDVANENMWPRHTETGSLPVPDIAPIDVLDANPPDAI